ncbi:S8 family serine peptidase [Rufibacter sp. LB8]|uniref:S8 family peptidase n=1 Tax=Rufibacter sp. LB8 TaxID=2777781 RepID=UPI00178C6DB2|nr:S8 family serine peptidase [Rufibacter sp. LB8]
MKKPILGSRTFLAENNQRLRSFEKFVNEVYNHPQDTSPLYTGRYFVILKDGNRDFSRVERLFESRMGIQVANTKDFDLQAFDESQIEGADALIFEDLGVALVGGEEDQVQLLESDTSLEYIVVPEKVVYIPESIPASLNIPTTWGLQATRAANSQFTGKDIKVAVLDTGFDLHHPDFTNRNIVSSSFVPNETAQDQHGHGTHCVGTACGNLDRTGQRYGVAKEASIYVGKVLSNQGSGAQAWILAGMEWAANNGCHVISMSLGSRTFPGQSHDIAYERASKSAMAKGSVVIAAAGNDSRRSWNHYDPVSSPADCPSVLAIAALDSGLNIADFSNRAINPMALIDIAAPGVQVYSSWPLPARYRTISGTSMATPHVAGIIALLREQYPHATPSQIISTLQTIAQKLPLLSIQDVGAGLATAP